MTSSYHDSYPERYLSKRECSQLLKPRYLADLLEKHAEDQPQSPLLYFGSDVFTYKDCNLRANALAVALKTHCGLGVGQPLVLLSPATPVAFTVILACAKSGILLVPLNTAYSEREFRDSIQNSDSRVVICHQHFVPMLRRLVSEGSLLLRSIITLQEVEQLVASSLGATYQSQPSRNLVCCSTSGSTGYPKGNTILYSAEFVRSVGGTRYFVTSGG